MSKIAFNKKNIDKCLCKTCNVQKKSRCVEDKLLLLKEKVLGLNIDMTWALEPEEFPGLYCGAGKSPCKDLDANKKCQCPKCSIWKEEDLETSLPPGYFCVDGPSSTCDLGECEPLSKNIGEEILRKYYTPF